MPPKASKGGNTIQSHLRPVAPDASPSCSGPATPPQADVAALKTELLSALRDDVAAIFKTELKMALDENLSSIKSELLAFRSELSSSISAVQKDLAVLKGTMAEVERSLSTCTDDVVTLQAKVEQLSRGMVALENKCDDLESRSRRQNIRIIGIPESGPSSAADVSKLLQEAFTLPKEPLVDRAHRTGPGDRPRTVIARLHNYTDCVEILKKARELQRVSVRNMTISVFPDYTQKTAQARAAFNEARRLLRGVEGVRFGLLHPARLRISCNGVQRDFTSPDEAKSYIKTLTK